MYFESQLEQKVVRLKLSKDKKSLKEIRGTFSKKNGLICDQWKKSISKKHISVEFNLKEIILTHNQAKFCWFCQSACRDLQFFRTSRVVWDHIVLIFKDNSFRISVGLDHLLMMASALDCISCLNFLSHQREYSFFTSCVLIFKLLKVCLNESYVFNRLGKIPHSSFLVAFLLVAVADLFVLLLADSKQRSARARALEVRSHRSDVKVFDHTLILHYIIWYNDDIQISCFHRNNKSQKIKVSLNSPSYTLIISFLIFDYHQSGCQTSIEKISQNIPKSIIFFKKQPNDSNLQLNTWLDLNLTKTVNCVLFDQVCAIQVF